MLCLYLFVIAFWLWFCLIFEQRTPVTFALFFVIYMIIKLLFIIIDEVTDLLIQVELSLYDN